jgi:predicted Zn-ribbon and HTH transcriptional regulator
MSSTEFELNDWYPPTDVDEETIKERRRSSAKEIDPEELDIEAPIPMTCPECGIERERTREIKQHSKCHKCLAKAQHRNRPSE